MFSHYRMLMVISLGFIILFSSLHYRNVNDPPIRFPTGSHYTSYSSFTSLRHGSSGESTQASTPKSKRPSLDIVVSLRQQNLTHTRILLDELRYMPTFRYLQVNCHVYTDDATADLHTLRRKLNTELVHRQRRRGIGIGAFTHIIENWEHLARHTMFIEDDVPKFESAKGRIIDYFGTTTGVLSLGRLEAYDCKVSHEPNGVEELYSRVNRRDCHQSLALTSGQVIVSAARIQKLGLQSYLDLQQMLKSSTPHPIHSTFEQQALGAMSASSFGSHLGSYMIIWGCEGTEIIDRCGGWEGLRQRRRLYERDDHCQCLDTTSNT
jgi:hypothetical protein